MMPDCTSAIHQASVSAAIPPTNSARTINHDVSKKGQELEYAVQLAERCELRDDHDGSNCELMNCDGNVDRVFDSIPGNCAPLPGVGQICDTVVGQWPINYPDRQRIPLCRYPALKVRSPHSNSLPKR